MNVIRLDCATEVIRLDVLRLTGLCKYFTVAPLAMIKVPSMMQDAEQRCILVKKKVIKNDARIYTFKTIVVIFGTAKVIVVQLATRI